MGWVCPNSIERKEKDFIVCKLMLNGAKATDPKAALRAFCAHQRYCTCKKRVINSEGAKECYESITKGEETSI